MLRCYLVLVLTRPTSFLYLPTGSSILTIGNIDNLKTGLPSPYNIATYKPSLFSQCTAVPKLALTVAIVSAPNAIVFPTVRVQSCSRDLPLMLVS